MPSRMPWGNDTSLGGGIIAAISLLATNLILTLFIFKNKGSRELLVWNSIVIQSAMDSEDMSEDDLTEAIREHGFDSLKDVRTAILELDGSISIIPYPQNGEHVDEHHLAPIIRKRPGSKKML